MIKGGYQIIDLYNKNHGLNQTSYYDGIYEKIEGTKKPILLSGISIEGVEYHDTFIFPCVQAGNFVAVVGTNPTQNVTYIVNIGLDGNGKTAVTFSSVTSPN